MFLKKMLLLICCYSLFGESVTSSYLKSSGIRSSQLPSFLVKVKDGLAISLGEWKQDLPIIAIIVKSDGTSVQLTSNYKSWQPETQTASTTLRTPQGTELLFSDILYLSQKGLEVKRTVKVQAVGTNEKGFSTRFTLQSIFTSTFKDHEFFMPGVWYRYNQDAPDNWFGKNPADKVVMVREDRTAYPLIMAYTTTKKSWGALVHLNPNGASFGGDKGNLLIIDSRLEYGSIGADFNENLELGFQYPASEVKKNIWMNRAHPLNKGLVHSYQIAFIQGSKISFADAVQTSWRYAFDSYNPKPPGVDRKQVLKASIDLLGTYTRKYKNIPSVPHSVKVPNGDEIDTSSRFGFTGKATLSAAFLMAASLNKMSMKLDKINEEWLGNAVDVIDFWVKNSMNPSGVPKTWYNIKEQKFSWRNYDSHIRIISDGMMGVLRAWKLKKNQEWLIYCKQFGDFLVKNQNSDGSFAGLWSFDGNPKADYRNTAYNSIPFLVELYKATGDDSYKNCALQAGEYSYKTAHAEYRYSGAATDNPNVLDKESGILALDAFLNLFETTKDDKWLSAAIQAGTYTETWTYVWNVPMLPGGNFPYQKTMLGGSIIATGHSGADNYMAAGVHLYKRLYDYTCDLHFLNFSQFLADATSQIMDLDGKLGYKYPGLLIEAYSVVQRGGGVNVWLPWLTACILEPFWPYETLPSKCPK